MRAVHLEMIPNLDRDCCLNAILRSIMYEGQTEYNHQQQMEKFVEGSERFFAE